MAGSLEKLCERMAYWCNEGNLGYDQSNRWDIRYGGEADCSSLVIFALREAGFDTGSASYTGDMSANLTKRGWKRVKVDGKPQKGDILLNDARHVAVCIGNGQIAYASIDENGKARGGKAGDQTGKETRVRSYYDYPWDCYLRYDGGASVTPEVTYKVTGLPLVKKGSEGPIVKSLQALLNAKNKAGLVVDGEAGTLTDKAIRGYQKAKGLDVDGQCGNDTWSKILTT